MIEFRVIHQAADSTSTWTITAGADVYTVLPAQSLDVTIHAGSLSIQKDAVDVTPGNLNDFPSCTLYLRDSLQVFGNPLQVDTAALGCWVFFWAWLAARFLSRS